MRTLLLLGLVIAGCGGSTSGSGVSGSCDTQSVNYACIDYEGPADIIAAYKNACSGGTWKAGTGCSHAGAVGGCRASDSTLKLTYTTWQYPPQTVDAVKQACQSPDVFVAP
jgi:hypothetical protein